MIESVAFLLSKVGHVAQNLFAEKVAPLGLRPRHVGVLARAARGPVAQGRLAEALRVAPSVVVDMVDELEQLGAVRRVPDPDDRRRHAVTVTPEGQRLLRRSAALAGEVDVAILQALEPRDRPAFKRALVRLAMANGITTSKGPA